MDKLKLLERTDEPIVSTELVNGMLFIFTTTGIYIYGDEKELEKYG